MSERMNHSWPGSDLESGPRQSMLRHRLVSAINDSGPAPVVLITAPAGFGKSTVASSWAWQTDRNVHWMQVHAADNTAFTFAKHLLASVCHDDVPAIDSDVNDLGVLVLDFLSRIPEDQPVALVVDDIQLLANQDTLDLFQYLLERTPTQFSVILLSRSTPNLRLGKLRAMGQVLDLTESDLAFTLAEIQEYLELSTGQPQPDLARQLATETEGWITGIMLGARSRLAMPQTSETSSSKSLKNMAFLDEYVEQEVLATLSHDLRQFVLESAFLPTLEPSLCEAVLQREDARKPIRELLRHQVFVVPVGARGDQFRYHHLFSQSIQRIARRTVASARIGEILTNLGHWHVQHDQPVEALSTWIEAEQWDLVVPAMVSVCHDLANQDLYHSLLHWLRQLPESVRRSNSSLAYWYTFALLALGYHRDGEASFHDMMVPLLNSDNPLERMRAMATSGMLLAFAGNQHELLRNARETLSIAPSGAWVERLHALQGIMECQFGLGEVDEAEATFREMQSVRGHLPFDQRWWSLHAQAEPANQLAMRGLISQSWNAYHAILDEHASYLSFPLLKYRYRLADVAMAMNDIPAARVQIDLMEREPIPDRPYWYREALMTRSRLERAEHRLPNAVELAIEVIVRSGHDGFEPDEQRARAMLAQLWLELGEIDRAEHWLKTTEIQLQWSQLFASTNMALAAIDVHLALGHTEVALKLSQQVIAEGSKRQRWTEVTRARVLAAVAHLQRGERLKARTLFDEALDVANRGNLIQAFLVSGPGVPQLLDDVIPTHVSLGFRTKLRHAVEHAFPTVTHPLSKRELEVLELVGVGLTNRGIGDALFISETTVKRHLANINTKLATSSRYEAAQRVGFLGGQTSDRMIEP